MRPLLCYNGYATGGAKAFLLSPYSMAQLGQDVGAVESETSAGMDTRQFFQNGKICQIENTIYCVHAGTIKRLEADGTWTTMASLTNRETGADIWTVMYPVVIDGAYYLALVYPSSSTDGTSVYLRGATYNIRTGALTTSSEVIYVTGGLGMTRSNLSSIAVVGGNLYIVGQAYNTGTNIPVVIYNVIGASISVITSAATTQRNLILSCDMCVWKNEIWICSQPDNNDFFLYKIIGSSIVLQATIASQPWSGGYSKPTMFGLGDYLYVMALLATGTWKMYRLNTALAVTDITSSVVSSFTGQDLDSHWTFIVDQHTNPAVPKYFLIYRGDMLTGPANFYKWNGDALPLTFIGSAGQADQRLVIQAPKNGGGHFMYTVGEMNVQIEGQVTPASTPGNVNVFYRIYESSLFPNGTLTQVKMFNNKNNTETATNRCSLTAPSVGSMLDNYTIDSVPAGSGTLHSVQWRAQFDGFSVGDGALLVAQASGIYS